MLNPKKSILLLTCLLLLNNNLSYSKNIFSKIKSEIKLKKEIKKDKITNIKPGKYEITVYELDYPNDIFEKNKFYRNLSNIKNKTKMSFLIDERFYNDIKNLKNGKLSSDEFLLELPASSLTAEDKKQIDRLSSNIILNEYKGTDQEYLNRQVYILYKLLNKSDYKSNYVYSELDKEVLITQLNDYRKVIINNLEKSNFDFFIKINYENFEKNNKNCCTDSMFDKTISLSNTSEDTYMFDNIYENIYIKNLPENLIKKFKNNEIKLKSKVLLLENNYFHGYTYNDGNIVVFINGKEELYYDHNYKIDVNVKKININDFNVTNSNNFILDFFIKD